MIARLLISGSSDALASQLKPYRKSHPDILFLSAQEKLGIAQARKIKDHFSLKPHSAKGRTVIIEDASLMTEEAQNALLKTLEELPGEAEFILAASSESALLPTILSRCRIEYLSGNPSSENTSHNIEQLQSFSKEQRFEYVERIKNREDLLYYLLQYFRSNIVKYPHFLAKVLQAYKWHKQNVNIRAILEYLMLEMPHLK